LISSRRPERTRCKAERSRIDASKLHQIIVSFRRELLEALGGFRIGYSCDETDLHPTAALTLA